ncbi:Glycosyltransferase involved in cell wall bisynthesis [Ruminococcaceae bacterium YRB3002]|nr:Glycosyltransferase involved in cell wall bisynthesis [Ruminococcaceae bacterium YRB3002]
MRICFIRSDKGYPDSRVEKEIYALSSEHEIFLLGWNREASGNDIIHEKHRIHGREFDYYLIPEPAAYGGGMKRMIGPMVRFWRRAFRFLKENRDRYDVIHVVDFDTAWPAFRAARQYSKSAVYDIFDYYADSYNAPGIIKSIIRKLENGYIDRADMTIICSEERRKQIAGSHPKKLIVVLNSPEDLEVDDSFEINSGSVPGRPRVVYAGMLVFDRFLKEMSEVMMDRDDIEWHVAGYGVLRPYIEECAAAHDNIFYYGPLPYDDILALEQKCDIMTALQNPSVPNNSYSAPNKFYEALMLGKPLIMIRNGSLYKEIEESDFGEVIDVSEGDIKEAISKALDRLIQRRPEWPRMGASARRLYDTKYPWIKSAETLREGYRSLSE